MKNSTHSNPTYFDHITQDNLEVSLMDNTQLYLIKTGQGYQIHAVSCGLDKLIKDPTSNATGYWLVKDLESFLTKVKAQKLQTTIFPNNTLTSNDLSISMIKSLGCHPDTENMTAFSMNQKKEIEQDYNGHMLRTYMTARQQTTNMPPSQSVQRFIEATNTSQRRALLSRLLHSSDSTRPLSSQVREVIRNPAYNQQSAMTLPSSQSLQTSPLTPTATLNDESSSTQAADTSNRFSSHRGLSFFNAARQNQANPAPTRQNSIVSPSEMLTYINQI